MPPDLLSSTLFVERWSRTRLATHASSQNLRPQPKEHGMRYQAIRMDSRALKETAQSFLTPSEGR